jgi:long-chain acyl-CoA synthetase
MNERNLPGLLRRQAERLGPRPAVRYRRYGTWHDVGYDAYHADALACAAALVEVGIGPGDRVGVLAENRLEWLLADMGLMSAAAVNVPPHAPLTGRQVQYQLADSGTRWLFVSTRAQLEKMLPVLPELRQLKGIVVFDRDRVAVQMALQHVLTLSAVQLTIYTWEGFVQQGRMVLGKNLGEVQRRQAALREEDLATIMYTSGTTGNPKGVMLTHGNLLSNVAAVLNSEPAQPDDVQLGWLPFSHIYARTMDHYRTLAAGILLALAESADTVIRDVGEIQPTHLNSVPRLYEKVLANIAPSSLAGEGRGEGAEPLAARLLTPHPSPPRGEGDWRRKLRNVFGPRIKVLCSGGAPLPVAVAQAYHDAGLLLLQGYGLTESSPVISFNRTTRYKIDTVGPALEGVQIKIAPDGEVLTRGPHVMKGYWHNPEATAETIVDGWLHTGDLGSIDADGFLKITGRKKEIMVLSNGKKLVPTQIEGLLVADPCIDQAVVHGEGKNFLTALIVPHWENLRQELAKTTPPGGNPWNSEAEESLCRHPAVQALVQQRITAALRDMASWEQVKKFVVLPRPFTVAADELTVSLKLRRNVVLTKYRQQLEALYSE